MEVINKKLWKKWRILINRVLENNNLKVTISDAGAELISVWDKSRNAERIWRGDSAVWEDMHRFFFRLSERLPAESTATGEESIR